MTQTSACFLTYLGSQGSERKAETSFVQFSCAWIKLVFLQQFGGTSVSRAQEPAGMWTSRKKSSPDCHPVGSVCDMGQRWETAEDCQGAEMTGCVFEQQHLGWRTACLYSLVCTVNDNDGQPSALHSWQSLQAQVSKRAKKRTWSEKDDPGRNRGDGKKLLCFRGATSPHTCKPLPCGDLSLLISELPTFQG